MTTHPPRVPLGHFPTPLHELPRLRLALGGPRLLIKRDDLTGLAAGGNKVRKLEYLVADALHQGAQTLITTGAAQSNHVCQTAAAAARYGLGCVLVLGGVAPAHTTGNVLLDRLLGAHLRWAGQRDTYALMEEVAQEERAAARKPYLIPVGGSNAIGAAAYVEAMAEMIRQARDLEARVDHVIVASGSGGTQAGLMVGASAHHFAGRVWGISVSQPAAALRQTVADLAQLTAAFLDLRMPLDLAALTVNDDYLGEGYGVLGGAEREAIELVARTEGLLLDPVYTGRAMAGLVDLVRRGAFGPQETVLFWHTGGLPALFAYAESLTA
ncbi:MAG: D-cysteine desulfhydrase family protein [Chloroflexota bacterium]